MAALNFTKDGQKEVWTATIAGVSGTILVDLERTKVGSVNVFGKMQGAEKLKFLGSVGRAQYDNCVLFTVSNDSDAGVMDVTIESGSEVTAGSYE